jgi:hypothetical protein
MTIVIEKLTSAIYVDESLDIGGFVIAKLNSNDPRRQDCS